MNSYNGDKYLIESLDSVLNQTYDNWELIFWDNGSTDESKKIIDKYQKSTTQIKYFYNSVNEKLGVARNKAIQNCNGKYITFLDVDDIYYNDAIENLVDSIMNHGVDLSYGGVEFVDENKKHLNYASPKTKRVAY